MNKRILPFTLTALLGLLLAGCSFAPVRVIPGAQETPPFRPPTLEPTHAPTQASAAEESPAAATQSTCSDNLTFLNDLSVPDGTVVAPESTLDKRWEVENSGSCNWGGGYRLKLIAGPEMGAASEQALFPARSGTRAVIRVVFKSPGEPGAYRSKWQAFNPEGQPFGDPFFIDIVVSAAP